MSHIWWLNKHSKNEAVSTVFPDLDSVLALNGEAISRSPLSQLVKVDVAGKNYYVKSYYKAGRNLRKYIGRSRVRAEWENLQLFNTLGIPTPTIIAYGEERHWGQSKGILITKELENSTDLSSLTKDKQFHFSEMAWLKQVIPQVAMYTRCLHEKRFVHNDLKWRNILVTEGDHPLVFFIDCPAGKKKVQPFLSRGKIKDLACLDKKGKHHLSRTQRLKFFCLYHNIKTLTPKYKKQIKKILNFFEGRE